MFTKISVQATCVQPRPNLWTFDTSDFNLLLATVLEVVGPKILQPVRPRWARQYFHIYIPFMAGLTISIMQFEPPFALQRLLDNNLGATPRRYQEIVGSLGCSSSSILIPSLTTRYPSYPRVFYR